MRTLLYYSNPDLYKEAMIKLEVDQNDVSLRWADNFKEVHLDRCDAVYIMHDISNAIKDRIAKHYAETMGVDVYLIPVEGDIATSDDDGEVEFTTLQEFEAYIKEIEAELVSAKEARDKFVADQPQAQTAVDAETKAVEEAKAKGDAEEAEKQKAIAAQTLAEAKTKADKETLEAEAATLKAEGEKLEAEAATKEVANAQKTVDSLKTESDAPKVEEDAELTRQEIVMALREAKVVFDGKANVIVLKKLYDDSLLGK